MSVEVRVSDGHVSVYVVVPFVFVGACFKKSLFVDAALRLKITNKYSIASKKNNVGKHNPDFKTGPTEKSLFFVRLRIRLLDVTRTNDLQTRVRMKNQSCVGHRFVVLCANEPMHTSVRYFHDLTDFTTRSFHEKIQSQWCCMEKQLFLYHIPF
jgi:hypothetical protein